MVLPLSRPDSLCTTMLLRRCTGDDLDTRLLRAMVVKGVLEAFTTARVNLVNADLLARTRGIRYVRDTSSV